MAGNDCSFSDCDGLAPSPACKEGPVLTMLNKRLRALKKKYNRILQIEDSKTQGKTINKEQEEVLKTKIAVAALIDEYGKLREPVLAAVKEEIVEREKELMAATLRRGEEEESVTEEKESEVHEVSRKESRGISPDEVRKDLGGQAAAVCNGASTKTADFEPTQLKEEGENAQEKAATVAPESSGPSEGHIADLLKLLYFAQLFDVRSQTEASSLVWTKVHERSSCLSYDFVTEDSTSPLLEGDLDALSLFGSLVTSRPPNVTFSHKDALRQCIEHAFLWLHGSDRPIHPDLGITYSHLRERLNRILSSEYFTMTPELQTVSQQTAAAAASAAGQYASQILMHETSAGADVLDADGSSMYFSDQNPATAQQLLFQSGEQYTDSNVIETSELHLTEVNTAPYLSDSTAADEIPEQVDGNEKSADRPCMDEAQQEQQTAPSIQPSQPEVPQKSEGQRVEEQSPVSNVSIGPRGYQGPKGGTRGSSYGTGGRGKGYMNGRGRVGRGGYVNGRNGQYYDQGGYYPRNYYPPGGGRAVRGGGPIYNGYANGQSMRATANTTVM